MTNVPALIIEGDALDWLKSFAAAAKHDREIVLDDLSAGPIPKRAV